MDELWRLNAATAVVASDADEKPALPLEAVEPVDDDGNDRDEELHQDDDEDGGEELHLVTDAPLVLEQPVGADAITAVGADGAEDKEDGGGVVEEPDEPTASSKKRPFESEAEPVVWHLSHRPSGRPRKKLTQLDDVAQIGFGGCGGMYNYFLGVASVLQEEYDLDGVVFSGVSAGCFPAMVLALGMDVTEFFFKENLPLVERAAACSFAGLGKWIPLVRASTLAMLPPDAFARADKKLYFSLTEVPALTNHVLTTWTSNEDMVDCMLCSGHVPLYTPSLAARYRGKRFVDGGLSNNSPIVRPDRPHKMLQIWKWRWISPTWVLVTTSADWALELFRMGREDATKNLGREIEEAFFPPALTGEAVKRARRE